MKHRREFYVPKGAVKVADKESDAVAYLYDRNGAPYALGFHGRAQKPDFHYRYRTAERREARVAEFFANRRGTLAFKAEQAAKRKAKAATRKLEVGHVLYTHWGYEQTNIEWFEVTALIGKTMVELREVAGRREETAWAQGKTFPDVGNYVGDPIRRRDRGDGTVKICDVRNGYLWDGKPKHWTAYH